MSQRYVRLGLLNSYIEHWAKRTPDKPAMIQHDYSKTIKYKR